LIKKQPPDLVAAFAIFETLTPHLLWSILKMVYLFGINPTLNTKEKKK